MNCHRFALMAVICSMAQPLCAQAPEASRPELVQLAADYFAQEKLVGAEIEPQLKAAEAQYKADLEALINKYNQAKRPGEADKVRDESTRFEKRGLNGEPAKTVPAEARADWANLIHVNALAAQSVSLKRDAMRGKFAQSLADKERDYRIKGDAAGAELAHRMRMTVSIRAIIEANRLGVTELVGKSEGPPWQDVVKEGGYVVGFEAARGGWFQFKVLGGLKPIFSSAGGVREGESRGKHQGERVLAKEGYAVGGLVTRSGSVVNCIQIMFMRINPDGLTLNPQDFYVTGWLGGEGGGKPKELSAKGRMVVGVTGTTSDVVDSLGMIYLK